MENFDSSRLVSAAYDGIFAGEHTGERLRINAMLLFQDSAGQLNLVIAGQDRHGALQNDHSVIELFVDEMNCAAGIMHSIIQSLLLCIESGESRKQGWMNVEDA